MAQEMIVRVVIDAEVAVDPEMLNENGELTKEHRLTDILKEHLYVSVCEGSVLSCVEEAVEVTSCEVRDVSLKTELPC